MPVAKWELPSARSSNLVTTELNNLGVGSESSAVTYDNSTARNLYGAVTIKIGSITPSATSSIALRVTINDGTDTADRIGGDVYSVPILAGAGAKIVNIPMIRLYPFSMRLSVINNLGINFPASGNELYVRAYNEDVT